MRVEELPPMTGPLAVYGGSVSNDRATAALLDVLDREGLSQRLCTGDLAAYCADPRGTVAMVRRSGGIVVAGNCEHQVAAGALDCGCGFEDGTACDAMSGAWWARVRGALSDEEAAWMAALPDAVVFDHDGVRTAAIHGGATDVARFVWPSSPIETFREEIAALTALCGPLDRVLCGHSGIAFERVIDGVSWINAGSVGMPPHDGRLQTRWAVVNADGVRFRRLSYDHEGAAADMERVGLTQGYQAALRTGWWPSEDVLPPELRR